MTFPCAAVSWVILCAGPMPAAAQNDSPAPPAAPGPQVDLDKAREHYKKAEAALASGDYTTAASEYLSAHEHSKDPVLFFKIAHAYHAAGDCEKAIPYYEKYVAEANPDERFKTLSEARIGQCKKGLGPGDTGAQAPASPPPAGDPGAASASQPSIEPPGKPSTQPPGQPSTQPPGEPPGQPSPGDPPAEPRVGFDTAEPDLAGRQNRDKLPSFADNKPSWQQSAAWVSVGVAVALLSAGSVLALSASSREEDIENLINFRDPTTGRPVEFDGNARDRYEELIDEGEQLNTLSRLAFGAAGAAAVAAIVLFVVDKRSGESSTAAPAARLRIAPESNGQGIGAMIDWSF